jgi:hypothetical protein
VTRGSTMTGRAKDSHKHCNTRLARPLAPARKFHASEIHYAEQAQKLMQDAHCTHMWLAYNAAFTNDWKFHSKKSMKKAR